MRIGRQTGRVINNTENRFGDDRLQRDVHELLAVVREAVEDGVLDERRAASLEDAASEVERAAGTDGAHSSRFRRALDNLKHVSRGATATAGIAEAVDSIVRTVASP
jgi:chaperonin GroEL (HSP60 family)